MLVSQSVLLLPTPASWWCGGRPPRPRGHTLREGLREGLGLLAAVTFAAVVTKLLVREQRARHDLAEAHGRLRTYAEQVERLAAGRSATASPGTSTTAWGMP